MVGEGTLQGQTPQGHAQAAPLRQQPGTTPELQTADTEDVQGPSRIQIEELLQAFRPTLLFVEHDRVFCEKIATKVVEM